MAPSLLVVNTGTDAAHYILRIQRLSKGQLTTLPAGWVRFADNDFTLAPSERRSVVVRVTVPASAQPGRYASDLVATGVVPHANGAAAAGAAAATTVSIRVKGRPTHPFPWIMVMLILAVLVLVGLAVVLRRSGIRLRVERR